LNARLKKLATIALVAVPLLAILAMATWYLATVWTSISGAPMSTNGYIAMALGVFFSLAVGFGLMTLLFYSSRHGYDEPPRPDDEL
jgi:hypothetical protein